MKIETLTTPATLSGVGETGTFKINNSAKAFSILSSGLYSNKIKAIVRELSCNAVDSHVEAGKADEQFTVHLPNSIEPFFSVRDYGIGLDHEGVTQLYTTYFESTKQDSNDYIGALGLGSKSPFSYTDNFTVTAIKDGIQRIYTAYIDPNNGCPAIAHMDECETKEGNGVEVKFPVSNNDIYNFEREAKAVFKWFKQKPDIVGSANFEIPEITFSEQSVSPGVHLSSDIRCPMAIQGNIAYPIHIAATEEWDEGVAALLDCPLVIEFEIGDLDIAASREELSYVDFTVKNIKDRLELVSEDVAKYVEKEVEGIKNQWDLAFRIRELASEKLFRGGCNILVNKGICKLLKVGSGGGGYHNSGPSVSVDTTLLNFTIKEIEERKLMLRRFKVEHNWSGTVCRNVEPSKNYNDGSYTHYHSIPFSRHTIWVLNDTKKGVQSRIRNHFKEADLEKGSYEVVLLDVSEKVHYDKRDKIYKKFFKDLLNPPGDRLKATELKEGDRLKQVRTSLLRAESRSHKGRYYEPHMAWDKVSPTEELSTTDIYYYVPLSNFTVLDADGNVDEELDNFLNTTWNDICKSRLLDGARLYGVRKSYIETVKAEKNWVCVYDVIKDSVKKFDTNQLLQHAIKNMVDTDIISRYTCEHAKTLDDSSPFKLFCAKYEKSLTVKINDDVVNAIRVLFRRMKVDTDITTKQEAVEEEYKALYTTYPMLSFAREAYGVDEEDRTKITEYIELIDNTRSNKND